MIKYCISRLSVALPPAASRPILAWSSFLFAVVIMIPAAPLSAATSTYYWRGGGSSDDLTAANNFTSSATNTTSSPPSSGSNIWSFGNGTLLGTQRTTANNTTTDFSVNQIVFGSVTDSYNVGAPVLFTISGSRIALNKSGGTDPSITQNSARNQLISAPLLFADPFSLNGNGTGVVTLSGAITTGGLSLTKTGTSTYIRSGTTTGTLPVNLNGGVLSVGSIGALGTVGTITFGGGSLGYESGITTDYSARFATANGQNRSVIVGPANSVTFATALTGSTGTLTKLGAGTLILGGTNTYGGGTTVSAGTLQGTATTLQGGIANNAAVIFAQTVDGTYAGTMSGTGSLTKNGAGKLTLGGANTYGGGTTVSAGTLQGTAITLQGGIVNNAAVIFAQTVDGTYAGSMSGTGSLTKNGAGLLTLSGNNTYSGATNVNVGTLTFNSANALSANTTLNVATGASVNLFSGSNVTLGTLTGTGSVNIGSGSLTTSSNANSTYSGTLSGTGSYKKGGWGTLIFDTHHNYTGITQVQNGKLIVSSSGGLSGSTDVQNGASLQVDGNAGGNVTVESGATLSGSGTITGQVAVYGKISPGNSPGVLASGSSTWFGGAGYDWQIYNASGIAGVGYDLASITGTLDLSNLSVSNRFTINVRSLSGIGPDVIGDAINFDNTVSYSWTIVDTTGGIIGFDQSTFDVVTDTGDGAGFSNDFDGVFSLGVSGNKLMLNYVTAVPEPASVALAAGLGALALVILHRRKSKA